MEQFEVTKIMAILSAFYGQGKADAETMAKAWSYILMPYDYAAAERAVLRFARNDVRDYATFPAPGVLVREIEFEQGVYKRTFNKMFNRVPYDNLSDDEKSIVSRSDYEWGMSQEPEYLLAHKDNFLGKVQKLTGPEAK